MRQRSYAPCVLLQGMFDGAALSVSDYPSWYVQYLGHQFNDRAELDNAISLYMVNEPGAVAQYGAISTWDTSLITDMSVCDALLQYYMY